MVDYPSPTDAALSRRPAHADADDSGMEAVKRESRQLRGSLRAELANDADHFSGDAASLLKFHGAYQQHDRDTATARKKQGLGKAHSVMIRARVPGGRLTAAQYLTLEAIADRLANGTMRVTTRQTVQFHGVLKGDLKRTMREINAAMLTTFGACGDVVRNVTACPHAHDPVARAVLERESARLSSAFLPATRAYHEVWIDDCPASPESGEALPPEPLYGDAYLPRKFKIGMATPADNCVDVLTNDAALLLFHDGETVEGYNLCIGGGLGMSHNKPATYPRLASPFAFVEPDRLIDVVRAVVEVQRDFGDRSNRKHARLKYLLDEMGADWFRAQAENRLGYRLTPPRPMPRLRVHDHLGWHAQDDGRWYLGIPLPQGRIADKGTRRLKTALHVIIDSLAPSVRLSPQQDLLIGDIADERRADVDAILRGHGVAPPDELTALARNALACPALPTCGLALTEAERAMPDLLRAIERAMEAAGIADEPITLRVTGCPNGCARPYSAEIGVVGRMPGRYTLFLGGAHDGTRLGDAVADKVAADDIATRLGRIFAHFSANRDGRERFGDYCHRLGAKRVAAILDGDKADSDTDTSNEGRAA